MDKKQDFKSRLSDVFGGLDSVGFKADSSLSQAPNQEETFRKPLSPRATSSSYKGGFEKFKKTDSIFQESPDVGSWRNKDFKPRGSHSKHRPRNPAYDSRRPERKDPKKYTKYSLADVKDLTDRSNTQAALSFLNQRKRQLTDDSDQPQAVQSSEKIVFKRPKKQDDDEAGEKVSGSSYGLSCGNSKRVLPEAVVGQTKAKKSTKKLVLATSDKPRKSKATKLSHLSFEDEEDDDE